MCDVAEELLRTTEHKRCCGMLKDAIANWRKHETLAQIADYNEVVKAGNHIYKLLEHTIRNHDPSCEEEKKTALVMSEWFETLTHDEAKELAAYVSTPYDFD